MQQNRKSTKQSVLIFLEALAITLLLAFCILFIFSPFFETNDDSGLMTIVCGARGIRDAHMVHSNYLLGLVLTSLFRLAPAVQWTSVVQIVLLVASYTLLTYALFLKNRSHFVRLLIVVVIAWFSYEGYVCIQYTKTGGLITAAGLLAIFAGLTTQPVNKVLTTAGFVLSVIGSFYRFQQTCCIIAIFGSLVIYTILYYAGQDGGKRGIVRSLIVGFCLLAAIAGLRVYDRAQYKDEEWAYYLQFDKYRTEVIDYGVPSFKDHKEEYEALGIDKTAYALMKKWTFQDDERFTPEVFKQIVEFRGHKTINKEFIRSFAKDLAKGLYAESTVYVFLAVFLGWLLFGRRGVKEFITLLIMLAAIVMLYFYLYYAGRFMIHRVDAAIWFAAAIITLLLYDEEKTNAGTLAVAVLTAALFITMVPWRDNIGFGFKTDLRVDRSERAAVEEINADQDHLYLTKIGTLSFIDAYGALEPAPYKGADNIYPLGGWAAGTPAYKITLKRFGISNPFRDAVDNKDVLLVDNRIGKTMDYINKWYSKDAKAELVKEINGHKVYRIVTNN